MRETVLFATKDNRPIAVNIEYNSPADKSQKVFQCKSYFDAHSYSEYENDYRACSAPGGSIYQAVMQQVDKENSDFLNQELTGYSYMKQRGNYVNNLQANNNYPASLAPLFPDVDYRFLDNEVPEEIRNLGFQLEPKDDEYEIIFNSSSGLYEVPHFSTYRAWVTVNSRSVKLVRNHFKMAPDIKRNLDIMIAAYQRKKQTDPSLTPIAFAATIGDAKDRSLFAIYANEHKFAGKRKYFLAHEFKHIKNKMFYDALYLDRGTKRPTVEDLYRLCVEDERSAYLSQVINSVNKYLINGNYDDFSMFDGESEWLQQKLQTMPTAQRKAYVTDLPKLVKGELKAFARSHQKKYDNDQFGAQLLNAIDKAPMSVEEDTARELFLRIRKQFYKFAVYNPDTGLMEQKSLADYIDSAHEVEISTQKQQDIIATGQQKLQDRQQEYNDKLRNGHINPSLVEPAKKMLRDNIHQPRFIGTDNLNIECLDRNSQRQVPQGPNGPNLPHHPNADWSLNLQQYWRLQDGYREEARTNDEYRFKIYNDEIVYTDKSTLSVSTDSAYATYVKILKEPSNRNNVINFLPSLSRSDALKLYVACVAQGHEMKGNVPTDLRGLENLQGIPAADVQRARQFMQNHAPATPQNPAPNAPATPQNSAPSRSGASASRGAVVNSAQSSATVNARQGRGR